MISYSFDLESFPFDYLRLPVHFGCILTLNQEVRGSSP